MVGVFRGDPIHRYHTYRPRRGRRSGRRLSDLDPRFWYRVVRATSRLAWWKKQHGQ